MEIQFLGATQTVTGSKYFIKTDKANILVDCGLFQGYKELRSKNWDSFPIDPASIDCLLLTHAHIDHSGYIPLLAKNGFSGKIFCSEATYDLCEILLPDSGHLHEEEARYANLKGYSKHHPALPLYTKEDAEFSLQFFQTVSFEKKYKMKDIIFEFYSAGHILGASFIKIENKNTSILFSGDLGRYKDPIMYAPQNPPFADYFVIESTYGDRLHDPSDPTIQLSKIINKTAKNGGVILIPAFAVGRAQLVLFYIHQLKMQNKIPNIPVFIDSPMATDATKLFYQYSHQHRLTEHQAMEVCKTAQYMHSKDESMSLNDKKMPMIIISASGMATGGRILHHIKNFGQNHRNSIIFCGFQAGGTRGDRMVQGEKNIKIFGTSIPIHAKIFQLDNMSAHADYSEILTWLSHLKEAPKKVFITHGENKASESLKEKIENKLLWRCYIPEYGYTEILG